MSAEHDRLIVITGGMRSGKTSELARQIDIRSIYRKVLTVNTVDDIRFSSDGIVTHSGNKRDGIRVRKLSDLLELDVYHKAEVVAIDEGNFYEDIIDFISNELLRTMKTFIVSGLNGDKYQKPFGSFNELFSMADDIKFMRGICTQCKDGSLASFSKEKFVTGSLKYVGGSEVYETVCRKHLA